MEIQIQLYPTVVLYTVCCPLLILPPAGRQLQCSPQLQTLVKNGFEFAFKVQQFANATDDEATQLFEVMFAVIEALHQIQKDAFNKSKAAVHAPAASLEAVQEEM